MADDDADVLSRRLRWGARPDRPAAPRPSIEDRTTEVRLAPARVTTLPSFERRDLDRIDEEARDRRRQLWRDTAMLLSGIVAALLVANLVIPQLTGFAGASPSPIPTGVLLGPDATASSAPGSVPPTGGPGGAGGAGRSPAPRRTEPPTGSPAPTHPNTTPRTTAQPTPTPAEPTPTPIPATPRPTPQPTPEPTAPPTAEPTSEPTPPATPQPGGAAPVRGV